MTAGSPSPRVMIVDDDPLVGEWLKDVLEAAGLAPVWHDDPLKALPAAETGDFDVLLLDVMMPGLDGLAFLRKLKEKQPHVEAVMLSARSETKFVDRAVASGAFDYLVKPTNLQKILATIRAAMTRRLQSMAPEPAAVAVGAVESGFLVAGKRSSALATSARRIAAYCSTVLIRGPVGSGKRHLAQLMHHYSGRPADRLVIVDLAATPPERAETAVLGVLGSSSHGAAARLGALKRADGGTLVLANVERLPLVVQDRIATLLDAGQLLEPPFVDEDFLDVKLIATTSVDLPPLVTAGRFHEDFQRRLEVAALTVARLGERMDEIVPLATHFLKEEGARIGKTLGGFSPDAERRLLEYPWPGEVAELKQQMTATARGATMPTLVPADLPVTVRNYGRDLGYQAAVDFLKDE